MKNALIAALWLAVAALAYGLYLEHERTAKVERWIVDSRK